MNNKLADRISSYQEISNHKLLPRIPIIISVNGRGFSKITNLLDKPYCNELNGCMLSTMLKLCLSIEGALFAYYHNDEITIVTTNDQGPDTEVWYKGDIQKICSVSSSLATLNFNKCASEANLNLTGEPIFTSEVFAVPNVVEATNTIVYKQQHNFHASIRFACFYELLKCGRDKNKIKDTLVGLSADEIVELLSQECGINFNDYPSVFRKGAACYKTSQVVNDVIKNKWVINDNLPIFTQDKSFLNSVFRQDGK
jgi:tRNA(His) 5'-end guanylyltransferase